MSCEALGNRNSGWIWTQPAKWSWIFSSSDAESLTPTISCGRKTCSLCATTCPSGVINLVKKNRADEFLKTHENLIAMIKDKKIETRKGKSKLTVFQKKMVVERILRAHSNSTSCV